MEVSLRDDVQGEGLPEILAFLRQLDPLTIVLKESPVGLCRRVLAAYQTEALRLIEEGAGILRVEDAALSSGMPLGPFWSLDTFGLEDYMETAKFLKVRIGERFGPPEVAVRLKEQGIEGRAGARGFYVYTDSTPWLDESLSPPEGDQVNLPRYDEVIQERLLYSIVGEAIRIYGEGVTTHSEVVDFTLTSLGIFPPHLGGPLNYASVLGTPRLVRRFEKMHRSWGVQFEPPDFLYTSLGDQTPSLFTMGEKI
jgi:3-hydroxyacyl-CoA dehydrogenase